VVGAFNYRAIVSQILLGAAFRPVVQNFRYASHFIFGSDVHVSIFLLLGFLVPRGLFVIPGCAATRFGIMFRAGIFNVEVYYILTLSFGFSSWFFFSSARFADRIVWTVTSRLGL